MAAPRISLVMIVRDEAELLPRFLEHARGLYDELCAVDTGSKDATVDLLTRAGAKVVSRPWDDDFSAARNASLALATGDWVLYLDADELAPPELAEQVRAASRLATAGAATVRMSNPLPFGHRRDGRLLRMFRNHPSVRFRHRIHEDVTASCQAFLKESGLALVHLPAPIEHLGYVRSRAVAKDKRQRDVSLLTRALAEEPDDLYLHLKLMEQARFWDDRALWEKSAAAAAVALGPPSPKLAGEAFGGELVALVSLGLHRGDDRAALTLLEGWSPHLLPHPAFFLRKAELHERLGDADQARAAFLQCLSLEGALGSLQLSTVRPLLGLARLSLAKGDAKAALALADQALGTCARDPEALVARAALTRAVHGQQALLRWSREHAQRAGDSPELHWALGEEAYLAGDARAAAAELRQAAGAPPRGEPALRLGHALLAAGDVEAARALATELAPELPRAGLGVLVCDLAQGRDSDLELDLSAEEADVALREWVGALVRFGSRELLEPFARNCAAVQHLFPWLAELRGGAPQP